MLVPISIKQNLFTVVTMFKNKTENAIFQRNNVQIKYIFFYQDNLFFLVRTWFISITSCLAEIT